MSSKDEAKPKIGAGHASAMWRQGLREIRGALYPESNVAQPTEYGIYGTRTPGEVAESRRAAEMDQEPLMPEKPADPAPEKSTEPPRDAQRGKNDRGMDLG